jgi:hypothetical protein
MFYVSLRIAQLVDFYPELCHFGVELIKNSSHFPQPVIIFMSCQVYLCCY